MKRNRAPAWGLTVALAWFAGVAAAGEVRVDYDPTVDFSRYATIGWVEGTPAEDPLLERKIHTAIERELVPDGFKETREDPFEERHEEPDLLLTTHSSLEGERSIDIAAFEYWSSHGGWKRPLMVAEGSSDLVAGMVIVDILDGESRRLIWRGVATGVVAKKVEKRDEKLDRALAEMFRGFPPKYKPHR